MRNLSMTVISVATGIGILGCSGDKGSDGETGIGGYSGTTPSTIAAGTGGATGSTTIPTVGGGQAQGGTSANPRTTEATTQGGRSQAGGATANGGIAVIGGTKPTGGTTAAGGATSTGGRTTAGGTKSTGGTKSAGGTTAAGGTKSAGGTTTTGGTSTPIVKFVGNITTNNAVDSGGLSYAKYWNQITPENAGKWGSVQSSAGSAFSWGSLDSVYDYAVKNNIIFKQHVFIWGSQQPSGTITETHVKNWMKAFCERYPKTALIDVVNEPPPHTTPSYASSIGGGTNGTWKWIINAFNWAREACPNAVLILNDYNNIEWSSDASHFISIAKTVKAAGAPIDAVGAQAHDLDHSSVSVSSVKKMLADLNSQTGLPVYITEFDISNTDDSAQLNLYKQYIPFFMETEYIKGVTIWGWIYGSTWSQAPNSGLVKSGKSRSAMTYLMDYLGRPAP